MFPFLPHLKVLHLILTLMLLAFLGSGCNQPNYKHASFTENERVVAGKTIFDEKVVIEPSLAQGFYFSFKDGIGWFFAGIGLLVVSVLMFIGAATNRLQMNLQKNLLLAALVIAAACAILIPPLQIAGQPVTVDKVVYDEAIMNDSVPQLWEDLYKQGRLIGVSKPD